MPNLIDSAFRRLTSAVTGPFRSGLSRARTRANPDRAARGLTRPLADRISRELRESLKKQR